VVLEQVIDRNGRLQTHATILLSTSRGDRLALNLPEGAEVQSILVNGGDAAFERGTTPQERRLRLPPSAGQVAKVVVEVTYGLNHASAGDLRGPELVGEVPVQQTLWRLWVPREDYVLAYDRTFARLDSDQSEQLLGGLAQGQPVAPAFRLPSQGVVLDFLRQGRPGRLSVSLAGKEFFNIVLWAVILAAGAAMLKLGGFRRFLIVLAALVGGAVVNLFAPLLARRVFSSGCVAAGIVLLLWVGHWIFRLLRRWPAAAAPGRNPQSPQPAKGKE
jgi:hypothetical protein